jgi:hypothetical protein
MNKSNIGIVVGIGVFVIGGLIAYLSNLSNSSTNPDVVDNNSEYDSRGSSYFTLPDNNLFRDTVVNNEPKGVWDYMPKLDSKGGSRRRKSRRKSRQNKKSRIRKK